METTYGNTRGYRAFYWIVAAACLLCSLLTLWKGTDLVIRGINKGKTELAIAACLLTLVFAATFVIIAVQSWRFRELSVGVSDERFRVGEKSAAWDEIESVEHPRRTIGLAFRVNTRDGRQLDVFSGIESSRQLEHLIKTKLAAREGGPDATQAGCAEKSTYMLNRTWCVLVGIALIALAGVLALATMCLLTKIGRPSKPDAFMRFALRVPLLVLLPVLGIGAPLLQRIKQFSVFALTAYDEAVRIGDVTVKWNEIAAIERAGRAIGVAFRVITRDGRTLSIPSGLERLDDLESVIKSRLVGSHPGDS